MPDTQTVGDVVKVSEERAARRRLRNFILDARFQLKYTGMVMLVTVAVAAVLGLLAYEYSTGQTELMTIMQLQQQGEVGPELAAFLEQEARRADSLVLLAIVAGIAVLSLAVGVTGIVITHRVVGPAHRISRLLRQVRDGRLDTEPPGLRRGDELRNLFQAFEEMAESLRAREAGNLRRIDSLIAELRAQGSDPEIIETLRQIRQNLGMS